jgi:hypothetical protein
MALTSGVILVKGIKEIKKVSENEISYTFIDNTLIEIKTESKDDRVYDSRSPIEKDIIKPRSIDSKKSRMRYKSRITGGQNKQGHTSVYE